MFHVVITNLETGEETVNVNTGCIMATLNLNDGEECAQQALFLSNCKGIDTIKTYLGAKELMEKIKSDCVPIKLFELCGDVDSLFNPKDGEKDDGKK